MRRDRDGDEAMCAAGSGADCSEVTRSGHDTHPRKNGESLFPLASVLADNSTHDCAEIGGSLRCPVDVMGRTISRAFLSDLPG